MPEQSKGKNARRPKPASPTPPTTEVDEDASTIAAKRQAPAPLPLETSRRPLDRRSAVNTSTLHDQPVVAYALAFALLALLLICALSIYLAAN